METNIIHCSGYDVETNIIHFSVFTPSTSPGAYIAEHVYIKCSAVTAESIFLAISGAEADMQKSLDIMRDVGMHYYAVTRFGKVHVMQCGANAPTLDMYLLNGRQTGVRLSHIVCFVLDNSGTPVESTIYRLGEIRATEGSKL